VRSLKNRESFFVVIPLFPPGLLPGALRSKFTLAFSSSPISYTEGGEKLSHSLTSLPATFYAKATFTNGKDRQHLNSSSVDILVCSNNEKVKFMM